MGRIHKYLNKVHVYQSRQVVRGKRQAWSPAPQPGARHYYAEAIVRRVPRSALHILLTTILTYHL